MFLLLQLVQSATQSIDPVSRYALHRRMTLGPRGSRGDFTRRDFNKIASTVFMPGRFLGLGIPSDMEPTPPETEGFSDDELIRTSIDGWVDSKDWRGENNNSIFLSFRLKEFLEAKSSTSPEKCRYSEQDINDIVERFAAQFLKLLKSPDIICQIFNLDFAQAADTFFDRWRIESIFGRDYGSDGLEDYIYVFDRERLNNILRANEDPNNLKPSAENFKKFSEHPYVHEMIAREDVRKELAVDLERHGIEPTDEQLTVQLYYRVGSQTYFNKHRATDLLDSLKMLATVYPNSWASKTMTGLLQFGGKSLEYMLKRFPARPKPPPSRSKPIKQEVKKEPTDNQATTKKTKARQKEIKSTKNTAPATPNIKQLSKDRFPYEPTLMDLINGVMLDG